MTQELSTQHGKGEDIRYPGLPGASSSTSRLVLCIEKADEAKAATIPHFRMPSIPRSMQSGSFESRMEADEAHLWFTRGLGTPEGTHVQSRYCSCFYTYPRRSSLCLITLLAEVGQAPEKTHR